MSDRKHIVVVLESTLGGTRKYCADLLRYIDVSRFRVTYIYATGRADKSFRDDLDWMRERGIDLVEIPMVRNVRPLADLRSFVALYRYFRRHDYDLVHAHSSKAGFLARLASTLARPSRKTIYQPHMMAFRISPVYVVLERIAAWFTDLIIADTESERQAILALRIIAAEKVKTVNSGVEMPDRGAYASLPGRDAAGIDGRPLTVGAVARLSYPKDPFTFIAAAESLLARGLRVRWVWVGDGDLLDACLARVRGRGLEEHVSFVGWRTDPLTWISSFDIFVHASGYESFGYVIAEAMSVSKPVVGSNVTGVSDLIEDGLTGMLYPPGDVNALSAAIERLAADPALAKRMGAAGRERVERYFTVERMVADLQNTYEDVLAGQEGWSGLG